MIAYGLQAIEMPPTNRNQIQFPFTRKHHFSRRSDALAHFQNRAPSKYNGKINELQKERAKKKGANK